MAIYPCAIGKHRYPQPQQLAYVTALVEGDHGTYRARLCPTHFRRVAVVLEEDMAVVDEGSVSSTTCDQCGQEKRVSLFARVFPSKAEERVFAVDACRPCADTMLARLQVDLWEPLPAR